MLHFDLPMVQGGASIGAAFEETIESNSSGLLVQVAHGDLRLVHFDRLLDALATGRELLSEVEFEPVLNIELVPAESHTNFVTAAGKRFGFMGSLSGRARLFSVSEQFGGPYTIGSAGSRCQRPNRPANTTPRDWYHYYPPNSRDSINPNQCRFCSALVP